MKFGARVSAAVNWLSSMEVNGSVLIDIGWIFCSSLNCMYKKYLDSVVNQGVSYLSQHSYCSYY